MFFHLLLVKTILGKCGLEQELPEDNKAHRVEGVLSQGQGQRGQSFGEHREFVSKCMSMPKNKGVAQLVWELWTIF